LVDKTENISDLNPEIIKDVNNHKESDMYWIGERELSSWHLDHERINVLKINLNPIVLERASFF